MDSPHAQPQRIPPLSSPKMLHDGIKQEEQIVIRAPVAEVYLFWRELKLLPLIIPQLQAVEVKSRTLSRWKWLALRGSLPVEWDSVILHEEPNRLIVWQSVEGSDVSHAGSVRFRDLGPGAGTEVRVTMIYNPPGGRLANAIERWLGENPEEAMKEMLRRLRYLMEDGKLITGVS